MRKKLFVWVKVWCLSRWANWSCQCQLPIYSADGGREGGWVARGGVGWGSSSAAETGRQCDMLSDAPIVGHSEFTGGWRMQIWDLVVLFFFPSIFSSFRGERRRRCGGDKWEKRCAALLTGDAPDSKFFSQQRLDLLTLISPKSPQAHNTALTVWLWRPFNQAACPFNWCFALGLVPLQHGHSVSPPTGEKCDKDFARLTFLEFLSASSRPFSAVFVFLSFFCVLCPSKSCFPGRWCNWYGSLIFPLWRSQNPHHTSLKPQVALENWEHSDVFWGSYFERPEKLSLYSFLLLLSTYRLFQGLQTIHGDLLLLSSESANWTQAKAQYHKSRGMDKITNGTKKIIFIRLLSIPSHVRKHGVQWPATQNRKAVDPTHWPLQVVLDLPVSRRHPHQQPNPSQNRGHVSVMLNCVGERVSETLHVAQR